MQKASIDDVERVPHLLGANTERRPLSRTIDDMDFAMVHFELEPGDAFSGAPHKHLRQEELFYVLDGTATFETRTEPAGEPEYVDVGPNEVVHFHVDDVYQTGRNETDELVRAIAIGVPGSRHDWAETETVLECPTCGRDTAHDLSPVEDVGDVRMPDPDEMRIVCTECGTEH